MDLVELAAKVGVYEDDHQRMRFLNEHPCEVLHGVMSKTLLFDRRVSYHGDTVREAIDNAMKERGLVDNEGRPDMGPATS